MNYNLQKKSLNLFWVILFISFGLFHCGLVEKTRYMDSSKESNPSMEWGPAEIKSTVNTMVSSLSSFLQSKGKAKTYLELEQVSNRSSEHIDTSIITNEISTNLLKKSILFVDRSKRQDALNEAKLAMQGVTKREASIEAGNIVSPEYILSGVINDNVRYVDGNKVQYILITLRLTEVASTAIVWQEEKKFIKETATKKIGW